jgi:hypothetical protein
MEVMTPYDVKEILRTKQKRTGKEAIVVYLKVMCVPEFAQRN